MNTFARKQWVPRLWRFTLLPLILFEFLVLFHFLDITPNFTKLGLFVTALIIFLGLEITYRLIPQRYDATLFW